MPSPTLQSEAVLAELEKVLSSGVFRGASRSSRLLRFLVEETLAGNGDRLKDYTLGAVALGRGDDFDPRTDPIARVEASRLRSRLELYYATEGAADTVTISLPKGGYVPQFDQREKGHPTAQIAIPRRAATWAWIAMAILAFLAVAEGVWLWRSAEPNQPAPEISFPINTPRTTDPVSLALSPDGKNLAFVSASNDRSLLWLHDLQSRSQRPLAGTDYASAPFWSPDSRSLGFFADGRLKRIDIDGGSVKPLARVVVAAGGSWNRDGVILFPLVPDSPLFRISENGGEPVPVTELKQPETGHRSPQFLPDGRHFLYYVMGSPEVRGIYVGDLEGGPSKRLFDAESPAAYATSGYLFFVDQGTLFAHRFDPVRQEVSGNHLKVAEGIASEGRAGLPALSVSAAGLIAYRTGSGEKRQFVWFDRHGKELERLGEPESFGPSYVSISPDYRRLAVQRTHRGNTGIWLIDLARGGVQQLFTADPEAEIAPVWLPNSDRIVFSSRRTGSFDLYTKSVADPAGDTKPLLHTPEPKQVTDASRDGRFIVFRSVGQKTDWDIWGFATSGEEPFKVVQTNAEERDGQFSPDGSWIAYQSNESGQFEIYMRPFRGPGAVIPISKGGGTHVRWAFDGRELFYVTLNGQLVSVPMRFSPDTNTWERGTPDTLFPIPIGPVQDYSRFYVVSKDGQRFLVDTLVEEAPEPIIVLLNWEPGS